MHSKRILLTVKNHAINSGLNFFKNHCDIRSVHLNIKYSIHIVVIQPGHI